MKLRIQPGTLAAAYLKTIASIVFLEMDLVARQARRVLRSL